MATYKLTKAPITGEEGNMILRSDGLWLPKDPDNTDYQAYLKFIEDGGQPIPAEDIV